MHRSTNLTKWGHERRRNIWKALHTETPEAIDYLWTDAIIIPYNDKAGKFLTLVTSVMIVIEWLPHSSVMYRSYDWNRVTGYNAVIQHFELDDGSGQFAEGFLVLGKILSKLILSLCDNV